MKRHWFQDDDGSYYRNIPIIMDEREALAARTWAIGRFRKLDILAREFDEAWKHGLIRTDKIGRRDVVVKMASFREAYPDRPGFWLLDELKGSSA